MNRAVLRAVLLVLFIISLIRPIYSQQAAATFLIWTSPGSADTDPGYATFISSFIEASVKSRGADAQILSLLEHGSRVQPLLDANDSKGLAEYAASNAADYLLVTRYIIKSGRMELHFGCIDAESGAVISEGKEAASPLLLLDVAVDRQVITIISSLQERLDHYRETPEKSAPIRTAQSNDLDGETLAEVRNVENIVPNQSRDLLLSRGISVSPAFGIFRALGAAASYFSRGLMPRICVSYTFALPYAGNISPGLHIGTIYLESEHDVDISSSLISPFAARLEYSTSGGGFVDLFFRASGGGAVISVSTETGSNWSKVVPYVGGGGGFLLFQQQRFSLSLELLLDAYFDEPGNPIIGYVAALNINLFQR